MIAETVVSAAAGLVGVVVGGWIASRNQRQERHHNRVREQLERFYAPLLGMRAQILAKSETRLKISGAAGAAWANLCANARSFNDPGAFKKVEEERFPDFEKVIEYNNRQLVQELLPLYQQMVSHFAANMWLAEPSTLTYFGTLVEFVEVWNRWLADSLPKEVFPLLGHSEDKLQSMYRDFAAQLQTLRQQLKT